MADTQETISDIIAEMRALSNPILDGIIAINGRIIADRLEAAHKREADYAREAYESALKAEREALREQYEAGALVDGTRGDCAKLREVVDAMMYEAFALCDSCVKPAAERGKLLAKWCNKLRAALAATEKEGGAK